MPAKESQKKSTAIQWHPASFSAVQLELEDYKKDLEFIAEYELSLKPLIIDILVVKKKKDIVIKKNFAKIFRKVNIIEYKSPKDYLAVADFYKVIAYANLYIVKNNLDFEDITITFIENRHPQKFLKHLRDKHKYVVDNEQNGIYKISGGMFPMQIIEISKLPLEDNFWLGNLRDDIDKEEMSFLYDKLVPRSKEEIVKMYADVVLLKANPISFEEIIGMKSKLTIEDVLERNGFTKEWEARGEAQLLQKIKKLIKQSSSLKELEAKLG